MIVSLSDVNHIFVQSEGSGSRYKNQKCEINSEVIGKMVLGLEQPVYAATLVSGRLLYTVSQKSNSIQKYQIPNEAPKQARLEKIVQNVILLCVKLP
jgi:hypothetical protein